MTRMFTKKKRPVLGFIGSVVLILSIAAAIIYELRYFPATVEWTLVAKGLPVFLLAIYAFLNTRTVDHVILGIALFASSVGDIILAVPENIISGEESFLRAIVAFSAAHLCYMVLFIRNKRDAYRVTRIRMNVASLVWVLTTIGGIYLYQTLGKINWQVMGYAVVLAGMVSAAQISRYPFMLVGVGAVLFFASDAMIGGEKFIGMPDWTGTAIWITYYMAQFLITMGVLIAPDKERRYHVTQF